MDCITGLARVFGYDLYHGEFHHFGRIIKI